MRKDFISVIIPAYDRCGVLGRAIESVLSQGYKKFELIVVDDGSNDYTQELLSRYKNQILMIVCNENSGPSAARNRGVEASSGEFIAFLDSDDLWLPEKLETQINFFHKKPGARICQTDEIWIRNNVRVNPRKKHKKKSGWIFDECLPLCLISPSAVMIHRSVFKKAGGFDENFPACEDYDLWLRIALHYPVYLIEKKLVIKHGGHRDQQSVVIPSLDKFRIKALCKILENEKLNQEQYQRVMEELKKKCQIYGNGCLKRGKLIEGRHILSLPGKYYR